MEKIDLLVIPGIGKRIKMCLRNIGINCVADLIGTDPEELYLKDAIDKGRKEDRCLLYVYRLAVYYANHEVHEPEKLLWWNWKDEKMK